MRSVIMAICVTAPVIVDREPTRELDKICMESIEVCEGCSKQYTGTGSGTIRVDQDLDIRNGDCTGPQVPECVANGCQYFKTTVKITNVVGYSLFWATSPTGQPRIKIEDQQQQEFSYPNGTLACGDSIGVYFFTNDSGGSPVAKWEWRCKGCPEH